MKNKEIKFTAVVTDILDNEEVVLCITYQSGKKENRSFPKRIFFCNTKIGYKVQGVITKGDGFQEINLFPVINKTEVTEQNEFLLAEIDWLEEELEKTLNTPIPTQDYETLYNCLKEKQNHLNQELDSHIADNEFLRNVRTHLEQERASLSASEAMLGNRLKISLGYNAQLLERNKKLDGCNRKLTLQIEKTKWYHLLFNIEPK